MYADPNQRRQDHRTLRRRFLTLSNELEKLCAYAERSGDHEEDIDLLVTKNLETTVFVLGERLDVWKLRQSVSTA